MINQLLSNAQYKFSELAKNEERERERERENQCHNIRECTQ